MKFLDRVNGVTDLKNISEKDLTELAKDLRKFIIDIVSIKEGHLGASLGTVELTIALHYIFNTPYDQLVWDVGHQAYGHKILTGRKNIFHTNREFGGISGFPELNESEFDSFGVGHSSTSISAVLGMSIASKIKNELERQHIAVIGDASIASGMAFEALNHAGVTDSNITVVLNDNTIGIDPSVGALKNYLSSVKVNGNKTDNIFELLNFEYLGPVDGHDISSLLTVFDKAKKIKGPKLVHIITKKGKGLKLAEQDQIKYHAPGKFDNKTGIVHKNENDQLPPKFQDVFGLTVLDLAKKNKKIIGITPAMPTGSSLKYMIKEFPERAFDVGIAEQHAVTFSAALAAGGMKPFCAIYSTFLQRGYDQLVHDVALQGLPVRFAIDRAGLVGADGATHAGSFDIAYLSNLPGMVVMAASDEAELVHMVATAASYDAGPIAFRYPRGEGQGVDMPERAEPLEIGKGRIVQAGQRVAILSFGTRLGEVLTASESLRADGITPTIADARFAKPLDQAMILDLVKTHEALITIEEGAVGGFGSHVAQLLSDQGVFDRGYCYRSMVLPDVFLDQASPEEMYANAGLRAADIAKKVREVLA